MPTTFAKYVNGAMTEQLAVTTATADAIPCLDASGHITLAQMPTGIGPELVDVLASEDLAAGDFVSFHDATGVVKARLANASDNTKPAHGFVKAPAVTGATASVYVDGQNQSLSGLTLGAMYFLSAATAGKATATPPSGTGKLVQTLGRAVSATNIVFKPVEVITLA